jgi:hypothetical protein
MLNINILIISLLLAVSDIGNASPIIKCKDKSGGVLFTQNSSDCSGSIKSTTRFTPAKPTLVSSKGKVNYRYPERSYVQEKGKWNIYVEKGMKYGDYDLYVSSLVKLKETLEYTFSVMPENPKKNLSGLKIFLLWGEASPLGGRKSSMSYIRTGEPDNYSHLDYRWERSLVIYSAENLMYLSKLWSRKAVFHEFSHAWHITNWPDKHPLIYSSWENAKRNRKYVGVKDIKGNVIKTAYAVRKNQLEYFAELSAMYFVGGNYYPFDKDGLRKYDPTGFEMVESLWN